MCRYVDHLYSVYVFCSRKFLKAYIIGKYIFMTLRFVGTLVLTTFSDLVAACSTYTYLLGDLVKL